MLKRGRKNFLTFGLLELDLFFKSTCAVLALFVHVT